MRFQALDWRDNNRIEDGKCEYVITVTGCDEKGHRVSLHIDGYHPTFYARLETPDATDVIKAIKNGGGTRDVISHNVVMRKRFYGQYLDEEGEYKLFPFVELRFRNTFAFHKAKKAVSGAGYELYESNADTITRFAHIKNINMAGWIEFDNDGLEDADLTTCQYDFRIHMDNVHNVDSDDVAPFMQVSFDIECYSALRGGKRNFPRAENRDDAVIQIGSVFRRMGEKETELRNMLVLGECDDIEGVEVVCFEKEEDLLLAWTALMQRMDPDMIIGHNIWGFDMKYMYARAKLLGIEKKFGLLSRTVGEVCGIEEKTLESKAYATNNMSIIDMPGRVQIDTYNAIKAGHKLRMYTLDFVSNLFLGDKKDDMDPTQISPMHDAGVESRTVVAKYCIQDCMLPLRLVEKLCIDVGTIQMANICWVPFMYILQRGQQVRVFSQILRMARLEGFLVPVTKAGKGDYGGGLVLEPTVSYVTEDPIVVLDFASMYPNAIIELNLCYTTLKGDGTFDTTKEGVLPRILTSLLAARKDAKREMKNATGFLKTVYDCKQKAIKVSCNSVYGFLAAQKLQCFEMAAAVTRRGQEQLRATKDYVVNHYDCEVVYGDTDSVFVKFNRGERVGKEAIDYCIKIGEKAADDITRNVFPAENVVLEYEKTFMPFLIYSKKKYAAFKYEKSSEDASGVVYTGIEAVRRDLCPFAACVIQNMYKAILEDCDVDKAKHIAENAMTRLRSGDVPAEELYLTMGVNPRDGYKNPDENIVCRLVDKATKRDPGNIPQVGDRLKFLYIVTSGTKVVDCVELYDHVVKTQKIKIDYEMYIERQLEKPLSRILGAVGNGNVMLKAKKLIKAKKLQKKLGTRPLASFFASTPALKRKRNDNDSKKCVKRMNV
jgi:DNA polymerase delta subunit 1